jgi:glycine cleavage system H protein
MEFIKDSHEWLKKDGDVATIGITKKAGIELGEIVYIDLPKVGQTIQKGEEVVVLESTKAAIDSYAPVSGVVVEVNPNLALEPGLVNVDPEGHGWLYRVKLN